MSSSTSSSKMVGCSGTLQRLPRTRRAGLLGILTGEYQTAGRSRRPSPYRGRPSGRCRVTFSGRSGRAGFCDASGLSLRRDLSAEGKKILIDQRRSVGWSTGCAHVNVGVPDQSHLEMSSAHVLSDRAMQRARYGKRRDQACSNPASPLRASRALDRAVFRSSYPLERWS
jgi:hypothetical protein